MKLHSNFYQIVESSPILNSSEIDGFLGLNRVDYKQDDEDHLDQIYSIYVSSKDDKLGHL